MMLSTHFFSAATAQEPQPVGVLRVQAPVKSCSGQVLHAFVRVLAASTQAPSPAIESLRRLSTLDRIGVQVAYEALRACVFELAAPTLGLRVGAETRLGECGVLDYALRSATTLRQSVEVAERYASIVDEGCKPSLHFEGPRPFLQLTFDPSPEVCFADFMLSIWHRHYVRAPLGASAVQQAWFVHPAPSKLADYQRVFGDVELRFGAPCYGLVLAPDCADLPLASGDPELHSRHCEHLERRLQELRGEPSVSTRVRELLAEEFIGGKPTAQRVAARLQLSRRTLVRRLAEEGTTFKRILNGLRREIALTLVISDERSTTQIAQQLGFTRLPAFYRAFRRWTGKTPLQYRETSQAAAAPHPPHPLETCPNL